MSLFDLVAVHTAEIMELQKKQIAELQAEVERLKAELATSSKGYCSAVERANDAIIKHDALKSGQASVMAEVGEPERLNENHLEHLSESAYYEALLQHESSLVDYYKQSALNLAAKLKEADEAGWVLAMQLLQSNEQLDDIELSARDGFIAAKRRAQPINGRICQHDLQKPDCSVIIANNYQAHCGVCLKDWTLPAAPLPGSTTLNHCTCSSLSAHSSAKERGHCSGSYFTRGQTGDDTK